MESEQNGLSIDRQNSECMVISKSLNTPPCNVTVWTGGSVLLPWNDGSLITQDGRCDKEIKR